MSQDPHPSTQALFRFSVVSQVLVRMRSGEPRADAIRFVAARDHIFLDGSFRRVSQRSIYRWLAALQSAGHRGLEPRGRLRARDSTVLPAELIEFLVTEKKRDLHASIPELIRRARELGVIAPDLPVHRATVYRTARRLGLSLARRKRAQDRDSRRFAYPHRMDMVLCDGKHFRAGEKRNKRVVLFFIDDATRYVLHAVCGTSETQALFQRGLFECLAKHGSMSCLYFDRGSAFTAEDTVSVLAQLEIPFVHGEAGYKEGRGKVERFNRTVKADLLRGLDGRPDVDPDCGSLELRLLHYTEQVYAHRVHESLAGSTPWQRFSEDPKALRMAADRASLEAKFEIWVKRRVSSDHVASLGSVAYEMPRGYAGQRVVLRRQLIRGTLAFLHEGRLIELKPVDLAQNAHSQRARGQAPLPDTQPILPPSSAELAHRRHFGAVVDSDGGFELPFPDDDVVIHPENPSS